MTSNVKDKFSDLSTAISEFCKVLDRDRRLRIVKYFEYDVSWFVRYWTDQIFTILFAVTKSFWYGIKDAWERFDCGDEE